MDKRKIANKQVKDKLLLGLIELMKKKEWSKITVTDLISLSGVARASYYRNFSSLEDLMDYGLAEFARDYSSGSPLAEEDFLDRELMVYKFKYYKERAGIVLAFHHAKAPLTLLELITDCLIYSNGHMPASSITKYELYYYSGAFYNMMLTWLEDGAKESPQAMADEFLRIARR